MAQGVLGLLVPDHHWVRLVLKLVMVHWWVELDPVVSGCRALARESALFAGEVLVLLGMGDRAKSWGGCVLKGT